MAKEPIDPKDPLDPVTKKGYTVGELESKAKQYSLELGLAVIFLIAGISTLLYPGAMRGWAILLTMLLAIVGVILPNWSQKFLTQGMHYICKDPTINIAAGVIALLLAIFFPIVIFALIGWAAGAGFIHDSRCKKCETGSCNTSCDEKPQKKERQG